VLDFTERRFCDGELFEIGLKHRDYQRR
jgi:hypothetical protein